MILTSVLTCWLFRTPLSILRRRLGRRPRGLGEPSSSLAPILWGHERPSLPFDDLGRRACACAVVRVGWLIFIMCAHAGRSPNMYVTSIDRDANTGRGKVSLLLPPGPHLPPRRSALQSRLYRKSSGQACACMQADTERAIVTPDAVIDRCSARRRSPPHALMQHDGCCFRLLNVTSNFIFRRPGGDPYAGADGGRSVPRLRQDI